MSHRRWIWDIGRIFIMNRLRSMYQYSHIASRLHGWISIFFCLEISLETWDKENRTEPWNLTIKPRSLPEYWCYISNTNSSVSLRFQTTRKLLKHEGLRARVFYRFRVVCHRNETRRMSVWNNFSNEWNGINCFSWYLRTLECTAYHD